MEIWTNCHPEANGRRPQTGDLSWTITMTIASGEQLIIHMGKPARDRMFGMMIIDCAQSGEEEPCPARSA